MPRPAPPLDDTDRRLLAESESLLREQAALIADPAPDPDAFVDYMHRLKDYLNTCAEHVAERTGQRDIV